MFRLAFSPIGDSYLLVGVIALVLLGLLAIGPGGGRASGRRRAALVAMRLVVIAMVLLAMLRPKLVYSEMKKQSATLVVLIDKSRSMSVPDAPGGKTRWDALRRTVADARAELAELAEDFELKTYTFDAKTHTVQVTRGEISLPETPDGQQTAIGAAIEKVLQDQAGKRLLGVLLLSDGVQTTFDVAPRTAAAQLKRLGYPLFSFPFGQSLGLGQAQDVGLTDLLVNESVFVKNELAVEGQVRIDGYLNREIPVELLFETAPGKMEKVAQENVKATAGNWRVPVRLSYAPQVPGEHKLTLRVAGQPGELVTTNNELSTFVNVLRGGLNVLYLEGTLRVETTFLRRALDASPDINVDYLRIDPRTPETRPGDLAERFRPGKYEVYVIGDLDSRALQTQESLAANRPLRPADFPMLGELAKAVEQGAGLIMLGGVHSFGPGGYANTPLADVLPVVVSRNERQRLDDPIRPDVHVPGPLKIRPTQLGLRHFALMLAGSREENEELWAKLPPLREGANRFSPGNLAPGALVLADAGPSVPLMIAHYYGNGRVMAFAGDSTWRWWMRGFESAHKRFWRQAILWLARKDQSMEGNVWVRLAKRQFSPSDRVEFTVGARSAAGEPIADATYEAEVVLPDETRKPVDLVRQGKQMAGSFRDTQAAGDYAIIVTATHADLPSGSARSEARFLVHEQDVELDNAAADADLLESLAAMTDGKSLAPEQLPGQIERLARQTERLRVKEETRKTFWDTWPFFLLLVGFLGVEWYLRKRWGLV